MNVNLYEGNADADDVLRLAQDRGVDVLVLEEITFGALEDLEDAGIDELLPELGRRAQRRRRRHHGLHLARRSRTP